MKSLFTFLIVSLFFGPALAQNYQTEISPFFNLDQVTNQLAEDLLRPKMEESLPTTQDMITARAAIAELQKNGMEMASGGGTWTGGGGEGIVCFQSAAAKEQAFDQRGRLKNSARAKIVSVDSFDLLEHQTDDSSHMRVFPDETPQTYIENALTINVEPYSPYFAQRLRQALSLIMHSNGQVKWKAAGPLIKIKDSGNRRVRISSPECSFVQLAIRYSRKTLGPMPEVFVDYDKDLYDRLSRPDTRAAHQAALILHEALYLAASDLGIRESADIRSLTALLLSWGFERQLNASGTQLSKAMFVSVLYSHGLKDVSMHYLDTRTKPESFSKQSRQLSRAALAKNYRKTWSELAKHNKKASECEKRYKKDCDQMFIPALSKNLSEEEAFLFLVGASYNTANHPYPIDVFITDGIEDEAAGTYMCRLLAIDQIALQSTSSPYKGLTEKAVQYCKGWQKAHERSAPKGTL